MMGVKYDLILVLRWRFFEYLRQTLHIPGSTWKRLVVPGSGSFRNKIHYFFFSYGKRLSIVDVFESLWLIGPHFRRYRQSEVLNKKTGCCPLPLPMAVSMIQNVRRSSCYCMRHSWLTKFGLKCLNQLVGVPYWRAYSLYIHDSWACYAMVQLNPSDLALRHHGSSGKSDDCDPCPCLWLLWTFCAFRWSVWKLVDIA